MVFENGVINIQAAAYNGARTVCRNKSVSLLLSYKVRIFTNLFCFRQTKRLQRSPQEKIVRWIDYLWQNRRKTINRNTVQKIDKKNSRSPFIQQVYYGNLGCQVSNGVMQNQLDSWPKLNFVLKGIILRIDIVPSCKKLSEYF